MDFIIFWDTICALELMKVDCALWEGRQRDGIKLFKETLHY